MRSFVMLLASLAFDCDSEYDRISLRLADGAQGRLGESCLPRLISRLAEADRPAKAREFQEQIWPSFSEQLDRYAGRNASGFLVSESLSAADIVWYAALQLMLNKSTKLAYFPAPTQLTAIQTQIRSRRRGRAGDRCISALRRQPGEKVLHCGE